jgi:thiosulfate/3-mercaptopyruvate sulfurtransferase
MTNMPTLPGPLVTAEWLAKIAPDNDAIRVVDASWYLPTQKRDPRAEYQAEHIPGAVFFDIDAISDTTSDLPHMLPPVEGFDAAVGSLGIANYHAVVVYDGAGVFSSPRAWWMFRTFGHDNVAVLQGGLPAWKAAGNRTDNDVPTVSRQSFSSRFDRSLVRDSNAVLANMDTQIAQVVDARSAGRFEGRDPEPRAGLKSGHIPGSINLPYGDLLDPTSGCLLAPHQIKARLDAAGINLAAPITTTCGSGISAALLALAFFTLGHTEAAVFDGSWAEWGAMPGAPID